MSLIKDLVKENKSKIVDDIFDDEYLSDSQYDPTDQLPHKEEMEEEYQPYE